MIYFLHQKLFLDFNSIIHRDFRSATVVNPTKRTSRRNDTECADISQGFFISLDIVFQMKVNSNGKAGKCALKTRVESSLWEKSILNA